MTRILLFLAVLTTSAVTCLGQAEPTSLPAALSAPPTVFQNPDLVRNYQNTITADELAALLYFFASDFFEGRETTARGQRLAAHYLASVYRKLGLEPHGTADVTNPGDPRRYLQPFPLKEHRFQKASLALSLAEETPSVQNFSPEQADGSFFVRSAEPGSFNGEIVFAGYGIADDQLGYNDFAALKAQGIDVAGKWVLVLRDEPLKSAESSLLPTEDGQPSNWTTRWSTKVFAARQFGALGVLIVNDVGPRADLPFSAQLLRAVSSTNRVGSLSLGEPGARAWRSTPVLHVSQAWADQILAPQGHSVASLKSTIDATLEPTGFEIKSARLTADIAYETRDTESENVVAFLEGSDPRLKHEVVVLTSHYDHVGMDPTLEGDQIFNGADDDGSGTVALLEIAEAFALAARDGYRPRRSILFLNVSGEEKGLLGSAWYADHEPTVPLENIVTNINLDMVGRFDPSHPTQSTNYVYIIGSRLISEELHEINQRVNDLTGIHLELDERFNAANDPNQFYRRSDHWNFGKHGIPFIFFFTGTHEDYHQVGDEAHKVAYDRMARISQLVFATAWQVANQDAPPAVSGTGFN